jgi:hypothetical protein
MTALPDCPFSYRSLRLRSLASVLLLSLLGSCAFSDDGTRVELSVATEGRSQPRDLSSLTVTIGELELMPCESGPLARLKQALLPVAEAHTDSSPTLLGTPTILDVRAQQSVDMGVLEPPPGNYCGIRVLISAADADANGLDLYPWMRNHSVALSRDTSVLIGTTAAFEFIVAFPSTAIHPGNPAQFRIRVGPDSMILPSEPTGDEPLREWLLALPGLTTVQTEVP